MKMTGPLWICHFILLAIWLVSKMIELKCPLSVPPLTLDWKNAHISTSSQPTSFLLSFFLPYCPLLLFLFLFLSSSSSSSVHTMQPVNSTRTQVHQGHFESQWDMRRDYTDCKTWNLTPPPLSTSSSPHTHTHTLTHQFWCLFPFSCFNTSFNGLMQCLTRITFLAGKYRRKGSHGDETRISACLCESENIQFHSSVLLTTSLYFWPTCMFSLPVSLGLNDKTTYGTREQSNDPSVFGK